MLGYPFPLPTLAPPPLTAGGSGGSGAGSWPAPGA
jgi:hypothetical protein